MTPERVAWGVALALVAFGAASTFGGVSALGLVGLGKSAPRPECASPYLIESHGAVSEVDCGRGDEPALGGAAGLLFGTPLDLNRAGVVDLVALPGIGPVRAKAIVAARSEGPFCEVASLTRVRGIGPRTVEHLAGWVRADCGHPGSTR